MNKYIMFSDFLVSLGIILVHSLGGITMSWVLYILFIYFLFFHERRFGYKKVMIPNAKGNGYHVQFRNPRTMEFVKV